MAVFHSQPTIIYKGTHVTSHVQLIIATFGLSAVHGNPVSEMLSTFLLILLAVVVLAVASCLAVKAFQLVPRESPGYLNC